MGIMCNFESVFCLNHFETSIPMTPFVHLHVHSQYSLLDGQASVTGLVDKAMELGMPGFALTDHGNMFGIKELANYVNKLKKKYKGKIEEARKRLGGCSHRRGARGYAP